MECQKKHNRIRIIYIVVLEYFSSKDINNIQNKEEKMFKFFIFYLWDFLSFFFFNSKIEY